MSETWKSPRKEEEERILEGRARFERYMSLEDEGFITRAIAIEALKADAVEELDERKRIIVAFSGELEQS